MKPENMFSWKNLQQWMHRNPPDYRRRRQSEGKRVFPLQLGTQRRHQKPYIEVVKRIHDGEIGELVNGQTFWCGGPIGFPDRKDEWSDVEWQMRGWYHWLWLSGDHILEQHVHNIDVTNWICRIINTSLWFRRAFWQERGDIWDHHAVHFTYPSRVSIMSMCSQYPRGDSAWKNALRGQKAVPLPLRGSVYPVGRGRIKSNISGKVITQIPTFRNTST